MKHSKRTYPLPAPTNLPFSASPRIQWIPPGIGYFCQLTLQDIVENAIGLFCTENWA